MGAKKILVVEDEKSIRLICKRLLARMGHAAIFAGTVKEAVETISILKRLDFLVTDMRLPDGDGVEVIQRLRRKFPSAKILIVTGSPIPEFRLERLYEMGFTEESVLPKPFEIDQFNAAIRRCIEGDSNHEQPSR